MAALPSSASAAEWLNAASGAVEGVLPGGFSGGRKGSACGDGEAGLKRNNGGTGGPIDIGGFGGGREFTFAIIGVQRCHCDCGEATRKPRSKTLVDDLDDAENGWMECLCQGCGECCEFCGARVGCHAQVRKMLLSVGGICSKCRLCDIGLQNVEKSQDRLWDIKMKKACCEEQRAKPVARIDPEHGAPAHTDDTELYSF